MPNDVDSFIPEMWAFESLMILEDHIMAAGLCYRDFEAEVASFGDTVNTRSIGTFQTKRKATTDDVTTQDATSTNVPVKLDQLAHVSFLIHDADQSKSFKDLVQQYLKPAVIAQTKFLDQLVLSQYAQFLTYMVPGAGTGSSSNLKDRMLDSRNIMNINQAPENIRNFIMTPNAETLALKVDFFTQAQITNDGGVAVREAALGRKLGFNNYMSQNACSVPSTAYDLGKNGAINNGAGYPVGTTVLTVDGITGAVGTNNFMNIGGDIHRIAAHSETSGATTSITLAAPGLRTAVVDNATFFTIDPGAVNLAAGYATGWSKDIVFDGTTNAPAVGQMVSFGTTAGAPVYTIIQATATTFLLDRPLEAALADNDVINFGPAGDFNLAFHREAIALVVRPLQLTPNSMGARSAVVSSDSASMRVTMTYDGKAQAIRVTLDMLCGVKVLNNKLGVVVCT